MTQQRVYSRDWSIQRGEMPLLATAIHNGHTVRDSLLNIMHLSEEDRLREEDPYTGRWTTISDTRIILDTSRFEVDLNRPRDKAVYRRPEDAWGLEIWSRELTGEEVDESLAKYDEFYLQIAELLDSMKEQHGKFVVFDIHSYNHRRMGPQAQADDPSANPDLNLGTGTVNPTLWQKAVTAFNNTASNFELPQGKLDVRENVKFKGGWLSQWIHEKYPQSGLCLAIEFKKIFMDEWTGIPDEKTIDEIEKLMHACAAAVLEAIKE